MNEFIAELVRWAQAGTPTFTAYTWGNGSFTAGPASLPGHVSSFVTSGLVSVHRIEMIQN